MPMAAGRAIVGGSRNQSTGAPFLRATSTFCMNTVRPIGTSPAAARLVRCVWPLRTEIPLRATEALLLADQPHQHAEPVVVLGLDAEHALEGRVEQVLI